uniref:MHC class II antigen beta chain n=1 Tax=Ditylenchus dipsaci TaxID=166011 RepID=A0A915DMN3_9BILA
MLCVPISFSVTLVILTCLLISPDETALAEHTFSVSFDDYTLSFFCESNIAYAFQKLDEENFGYFINMLFDWIPIQDL